MSAGRRFGPEGIRRASRAAAAMQAPFVPGAYGTLVLDLDPIASKITLNGGDVSAWADSSGNGYGCQQTTGANQPLYNASDSGYAGKPTVQFTEANQDWLVSTSFSFPANSAFTIFVVGETTASADDQLFAAGAALNGLQLWLTTTSTSTLRTRTLVAPTADKTTTLATKHVYEGFGDATAMTSVVDGTAGTAVGGVGSYSAASVYRVGRRFDDLFHLGGKIARLLLYSNALSAGNRSAVRAILGSLYGVTVV